MRCRACRRPKAGEPTEGNTNGIHKRPRHPALAGQYDPLPCARHFDIWMVRAIKEMMSFVEPLEQGFIDQRGNFLTREEAHKVATEAGQIIRRCGGDDGRLFSENLY